MEVTQVREESSKLINNDFMPKQKQTFFPFDDIVRHYFDISVREEFDKIGPVSHQYASPDCGTVRPLQQIMAMVCFKNTMFVAGLNFNAI